MSKEDLARYWIDTLSTNEPDQEFRLSQKDMDLIKAALIVWLKKRHKKVSLSKGQVPL